MRQEINAGGHAAGLVGLLLQRRLTLATAESCTGGLVGGLITAVAGASSVYVGGWVTYSNQMKVEQLGVMAGDLDSYGAVSGQVAMGMARGAAEKSGADVGVSVTGVAGPDGGTTEKPVGTVWFGFWASPGVSLGVGAARCLFEGKREQVRQTAAGTAVWAVRRLLLGQTIEAGGVVTEVVGAQEGW